MATVEIVCRGSRTERAADAHSACRNCGAARSVAGNAPSFGSRWSSLSSTAHAGAGDAQEDGWCSHQESEEAQDVFCSPECFWSAELAPAGPGASSNASSRSHSPMTMGVNPFADSSAQRDTKRQAWDPSEGIRGSTTRAVERNPVENADNAMYLFHAGLSSTFRPENTFRVL
ncbi:hypothetical protein FVE85_5210 [Porphyridium purpureum]|uniref:Uncharacterized protein n=1 Tax=Porphyridium purpureum TaxID=35688 RepID=A0A5J4Z2W8_PORPP|nr:hypothetical protein FVE85_5210 [Porphyridium purpureum]|eukprot:POR3307..scf295_1